MRRTCGDEQKLDGCLDRLLVHLERRRSRRTTGVVDDDVDHQRSPRRSSHENAQIGRHRHIAAHREVLRAAVGLAFEDVSAASEHRDVAPSAVSASAMPSPMPEKPADDRGTTFEVEVHGSEGELPTQTVAWSYMCVRTETTSETAARTLSGPCAPPPRAGA